MHLVNILNYQNISGFSCIHHLRDNYILFLFSNEDH